MKQKYKIYASLIDGYYWYRKSEKDEAFQNFIDRINRVETTDPAVLKRMRQGIEYENLINARLKSGELYTEPEIEVGPYKFQTATINQIISELQGSIKQVYCQTEIENFMVYGYADFVLMDRIIDTKKVGNYDLGKFTNGIQHHLYPLCLTDMGNQINYFEYWGIAGDDLLKEQYKFDYAESRAIVLNECRELEWFIETNRDLITNTKIFWNE